MSYTPTTWATGDTLTATAMNKIENGIANAGGYDVVIHASSCVLYNTSAYTLESGSFTDAVTKLTNGELLTVYIWGCSEEYSQSVCQNVVADYAVFKEVSGTPKIEILFNYYDWYEDAPKTVLLAWTAGGIVRD